MLRVCFRRERLLQVLPALSGIRGGELPQGGRDPLSGHQQGRAARDRGEGTSYLFTEV